MDEELSVLIQEFYDEIGRAYVKKDYNIWLKSTEFALQKLMVDKLDEIRWELRDLRLKVGDIGNYM